jgi:hypothetical protein
VEQACNAESMPRRMIYIFGAQDSDISLKMPCLENNPLRANIIIHIFYKSLVYFSKQK